MSMAVWVMLMILIHVVELHPNYLISYQTWHDIKIAQSYSFISEVQLLPLLPADLHGDLLLVARDHLD